MTWNRTWTTPAPGQLDALERLLAQAPDEGQVPGFRPLSPSGSDRPGRSPHTAGAAGGAGAAGRRRTTRLPPHTSNPSTPIGIR